MTPDRDDSPDREKRLNQAIAEYLQAAESGRAPDRRRWLARHPQFAQELAEFFALQDELGPLRPPANTW